MSNAQDEDSLLAEYEFVLQSAAQLRQEAGLPLEFLDIGGGFSSPYAVPGPRTDYPKLRAGLEVLLDLYLPEWRDGGMELACESGRYLSGSSGSLLAGVVNVKESRGRRFVILDGGINVLGGLSGIGRLLPAAIGVDGEAPLTGSLVGPLCTPGDSLAKAAKLPELSAGDVVTVPNVGAYGGSIAAVPDRRTVIVSSMASDSHTWNLVYLELLVGELGFDVVNLGACVPDELLESECLSRRPAMLVLSSVNGHGYQDGLRVIQRLRAFEELRALPVVIGGKLGVGGPLTAQESGQLLLAGFDAVFDDHQGAASFRQFAAALPGAGAQLPVRVEGT